MEVRHRRSSWSPRRVKSRLLRSFHTVKIHPPRDEGIKSRREAPHWYRHLRKPNLSRFVQNYEALQSALQVVFLPWRDVQINPEAVGTDFEFFIPAEIRTVGLQECFGDVAVPKLVPPPIFLRLIENRDGAVTRPEPQKQSFPRPQ